MSYIASGEFFGGLGFDFEVIIALLIILSSSLASV
jgi:hypothetical protein